MNLPAHNDDNGASEQVEPDHTRMDRYPKEDRGLLSLRDAVVFGGGGLVVGLLIVGALLRGGQ
jgi:hypothetical protein